HLLNLQTEMMIPSVLSSLLMLKDKLKDFCKEELKKVSDRGKVLEIHLLSEMSPSSSHIMENIILEMC
ncbi:hypothetical protein M9458_027709, partial [Cirrhinus mrigala]